MCPHKPSAPTTSAHRTARHAGLKSAVNAGVSSLSSPLYGDGMLETRAKARPAAALGIVVSEFRVSWSEMW